MKTKNILCFSIAVTLLFEVLACSAQTGAYLFTGSETNITLAPGTYNITAIGGQGGAYGYAAGGLGAEMEAQVGFTNPTTLTLLVGGGGYSGQYGGGGGGGGGSFVVNGTTPLVIAGGGAGAGAGYGGPEGLGTSGVTQTNGGNGVGIYAGAGGSSGGGGYGAGYPSGYGSGYGGSGGGGYSGDGTTGTSSAGGSSFLNGGSGGSGGYYFGGSGGYGGGGGGGSAGGGGGGGYSGGGGGGWPNESVGYSGGGGGSIIDSSTVAILAEISGVSSPDDSPNGEIIILVYQPPVFTEQPTFTGGFTSNVTFQAAVEGATPLTCQWYFNNVSLSDNGHFVGSTKTNLTIMDFEPVDIGNYTLVVTNMFGSVTSAVATLTITSPPVITNQPTDITTPGASSPSFAVTAAGTGPFSYQWEFDDTNIVGATNAILTLNNVQMDQTGPYDVLVSNAYGGVISSNAILTVVPLTVAIQPPSQSAKEDTTVSFNTVISGQGPFSYQWQFGATNIPNATNGALTLTGLQVNQSGAYAVVVSNSFGVVTSSNAQLTVIPWPNIQPPSQTNLIGATVSFTANFGGATPLAYQWLFSGTNLSDNGHFSGTATASLSISNIQSYDIGNYQVVINAAGSMETSSVAYLIVTNSQAATRYVNLSNSSPTYPYMSWSTAATNIQDAIDAAFAGDQILVTNGTYLAGGRVVYGSLTNRVVVNKAVTVQSVNGPAVTAIQGSWTPGTTNGNSSVRCVYLTNNTALIGFKLTNGATRNSGDSIKEESGGGVWCESTNNVVIANCVITANGSWNQGGGVYQGTLLNCTLVNNSSASGGGAASAVLLNCTLSGNSATNGGGAYLGVLNNCVVTSNTASGSLSDGGGVANARVLNSVIAGNSAGKQGGGAYNGILVNCTVTGNSATNGAGTASCAQTNCIIYYNTPYTAFTNITNWSGGTFSYCCTRPLPSGTGNFTNDPALSSLSHLSFNSPCRGAGNAAATSGTDIDGEPWANLPSIGCDELYPGNVNGNLSLSISTAFTNLAPGYAGSFQANIFGAVNTNTWDFGDGTIVSNQPYVSHAWSSVGDYSVVLTAYNDTYPTGLTATLVMHISVPTVFYVDLNSIHPVAPYSYWSTAAVTIQNAIDAASPGDLILVTNGYSVYYLGEGFHTNYAGVYQTGGRVVYGSLTNRVVINKAVTVQSVNGPSVTMIQGNADFSSGYNAARCVYMTNGATLIGFTLTNGGTAISSGDAIKEKSGGGVWCESTNALIENCVLTTNLAYNLGCGVYLGTLSNCVISKNINWSGSGSGAAHGSSLFNCTISSNYSSGLSSCFASNCVLAGNSAPYGGASSNCILINCVMTNNAATYGGGAFSCFLTNCFLANNRATGGSGYGGGAFGGTMNNCILTGNSGWLGGAVCGGVFNGGTYSAVANNCIITNNTAAFGGATSGTTSVGGNSLAATMNNCTLSANIATNYGGASFGSILNNCAIENNRLVNPGAAAGGCEGGTLNYCLLSGNSASNGNGGGADGSLRLQTLNNCVLSNNYARNGGGAAYCNLNNCLIISNYVSTAGDGGGIYYGGLNNCLLVGNSLTNGGSGSASYFSTLNNSTVLWNSAGVSGNGAVYSGSISNSIIYYNIGGNFYSQGSSRLVYYCCVTPLATNGIGNITNEPAFANLAAGDFHLQSNSPCINSGNNAYVVTSTDYDSNQRIVGGTVDIGAYEYQTPSSVLSYAWAQQYSLPTDGSADYADPDGDGMNNWQEWKAGTNPTNAASVLQLSSPSNSVSGIIVTWQSVTNVTYYLQSSTNLAAQPAFISIQSNLVGQAGSTSYTDTTATNGGSYFYRVGVQ